MLVKTRRLVKIVIGQLGERFRFETVRAKDLWHLNSRINRKLLSHTVAFWLNYQSLFIYFVFNNLLLIKSRTQRKLSEANLKKNGTKRATFY